MSSLQKRHDREVRSSGEYITQNRKWVVLIFLLAIIIGIVISEKATSGKITPYFDGGWLTYLVHEIIQSINEVIAMFKEALMSLRF